jgi:hypothetical protein
MNFRNSVSGTHAMGVAVKFETDGCKVTKTYTILLSETFVAR